jgi:hypothetical protein
MEKLKEIITRQLGRSLESPRDFEYLSEQIQLATSEYLSPTTLKRIFGYIPQTSEPRTTTLSILARYIGCKGWQDYLTNNHTESDFIAAKKIITKDLSIGQKIILAWNPDRECMIEYLGNNRFVVLHATNAKMQVGDQFTTTQFILGQALTATEYVALREPNTKQDTYIAGAQSGLTKLELFHV